MARSRLTNRSSRNGNGRFSMYGDGYDPIAANRLRRLTDDLKSMIGNVASMRRDWLDQSTDPRRDIDDECGYPKTASITPQAYQNLYEREAVAARVVEIMPKECFQVSPEVYEAEKGQVNTAFEKGWQALGGQLRGGWQQNYFHEAEGSAINEMLVRADIHSGIGQYGIILYGLNDGLDMRLPVAGVEESGTVPVETVAKEATDAPTPTTASRGKWPQWKLTVNQDAMQGRRLLFMRSFPEALARISRVESNPASPRFGQPVTYQVTFNDPSQQISGVGWSLTTREVHWTRVRHIADTNHSACSSEVLAVPRLRPVFNDVDAVRKVRHGAAEGYWKWVFAILSLETHPQLGGDVEIDEDDLKDMIEQLHNGLQRAMFLRGMSAKSVASQVVDPTPFIAAHIEAICIKGGYPVRVFKGSERGELASTQDDAAWNDRVKQRQTGYVTPRIIVPFVNDMVALGIVPAPQAGFKVFWPDITSMSAEQKAVVALQRAQALTAYVNGNVEQIMTPLDFLTREFGYSEDEAIAVLENAVVGLETLLAQRKAPEQIQPVDEEVVEPEPVEGESADDEPEGAAVAAG